MKVLFVASGNRGQMSPIVKNQMEALASDGIEIDCFLITGKGFGGYLRNISPLRQYMLLHKHDVVHAHYSLSAFVASLAGAHPLVVSLMGSDVKASFLYRYLIRLFALLFRWESIIVKSDDMHKNLGIRKAVVIPNGVDFNRFYPMDKSVCQNRIGWSSTKKHVLFPADKDRPEKDYPLAAASVSLLENVTLHSFSHTPHEETPYWYNAADVVLLTSKWEGSPNAIKEAMACSRPIVSTNVGDVSERTRGLGGCYVVSNRNPIEMSKAISNALSFSATKGKERISADGLGSEQTNKKLITIYNSCI